MKRRALWMAAMLAGGFLLLAAALLPEWYHRALLSIAAAMYLCYGTVWAMRHNVVR
ncbi:MAG: hypothetical protein U0836_13655 [Pirellulales bacterium]